MCSIQFTRHRHKCMPYIAWLPVSNCIALQLQLISSVGERCSYASQWGYAQRKVDELVRTRRKKYIETFSYFCSPKILISFAVKPRYTLCPFSYSINIIPRTVPARSCPQSGHAFTWNMKCWKVMKKKQGAFVHFEDLLASFSFFSEGIASPILHRIVHAWFCKRVLLV